MSVRFFINVRSDLFSDEILLETQGDIPIGELQEDILKILNWPIEVNGTRVDYSIHTEEKELNQSDTLISAGLNNFEPIWVSPTQTQNTGLRQEKHQEDDQQISVVQAPYWSSVPVDRPSLIHPDGYLFVLDQLPVLIGRKGGDKQVQIDLSEFEQERYISSRCHAEVILKDQLLCLHAFKTRNGTFIGRDEIQPGEVQALKNNDVIQFGMGGVRLIFREPFTGKV